MRLWHRLSLAALVLLSSSSTASAQTTHVEGAVQARAGLERNRTLRVTVRLADGGLAAQGGEAVRAAAVALAGRLAQIGVTDAAPIGQLPYVTAVIDRAQLEALLRDQSIAAIYVEEGGTTQLIESVPLIKAPSAWAVGAQGTGEVVAVIDTGVEKNHPFLSGKVVAEACFSADLCTSGEGGGPGKGAPCSQDGCYHGTHVAGIVAGRNSSMSGVAPDGRIIAIQAFSTGTSRPTIWDSDLAQALEHVRVTLAPTMRIAAVNLSLGWPNRLSASACDAIYPPVTDAINGLKSRGIAVVVASGNGYVNNGISYPACISAAVAVGSTGDGSGDFLCSAVGRDAVADYSNSAGNIDLLAPGTCINSAVTGGGFLAIDGTSMAAPHVAGAFAAIRSKSPGLSVSQIEQALVSTGVAVTDPDNGVTKTRIDLAKALGVQENGWGPWASRGGSIISYPDCLLTGSRIDCWARSAGNTLVWNRTNDGATWSGWTDLGGSLTGPPRCLVRGSRMDCFVTTAAKQLAQITHDGSRWGGWTSRGGSVGGGQPSCIPGSGLALECFATGSDNSLYRYSFDRNAWRMPAKLTGIRVSSRPDCVARGSGIDCFVVDKSKNLQTVRLSGGKFGKWKKLTGNVGLPPHCLVNGSKLDCFAQTANKQLLKGFFDGSRWSAWSNLGGSVNAQPWCNAVSGGFDCYWTTAGFDLVQRKQRSGSWQAESNLDGAVQQRPVCLSSNGGARIDCLARGSDNTLQQRTYR